MVVDSVGATPPLAQPGGDCQQTPVPPSVQLFQQTTVGQLAQGRGWEDGRGQEKPLPTTNIIGRL